ncbi:MAG: hypothetical protein ACLQIJ_00425 [Polyangia bacterium]
MLRLPCAVSCPAWVSVLLLAGCSVQMVELRPLGAPSPGGGDLEVVPVNAGAADPLPVSGARLAFSQVVPAVGDSISAACAHWAERHRNDRKGGWQMQVDLIRSQADRHDGLLTVELETRVTLRTKSGRMHLGQTRGYCKTEGALDSPAKVGTQCLERMAQDLSGWLDSVQP